jgi:hypothetical protein
MASCKDYSQTASANQVCTNDHCAHMEVIQLLHMHAEATEESVGEEALQNARLVEWPLWLNSESSGNLQDLVRNYLGHSPFCFFLVTQCGSLLETDCGVVFRSSDGREELPRHMGLKRHRTGGWKEVVPGCIARAVKCMHRSHSRSIANHGACKSRVVRVHARRYH